MTSNGTTITYIYRVDITRGQISPGEAKKLLLKEVKPRMCAQELFPEMVASGARYEFVYEYRSGGVLTQFSIDTCQ